MKLCMNRPEGWGPQSTLSSPIPTTCFTDVILIPLPVWLYLLLLPILFVLTLHARRNYHNPSTAHLRVKPLRSCFRTTIHILYYLLIVANILMHTLEIVRLCLINFGVGLLPFAYVALLIGLLMHATNGVFGSIGSRSWIGANVFVWTGLMVLSVVKTVGLVYQENKGVKRMGSKYPVSDQVIDVAVMAGVYLALVALELWLGIWRAARSSRAREIERRESVEAVAWAK